MFGCSWLHMCVCVLLTCAVSGVSCLDVAASGSQRGKRSGLCYVAACQAAALRRMLKVRQTSSQPVHPLRLPLCCFTVYAEQEWQVCWLKGYREESLKKRQSLTAPSTCCHLFCPSSVGNVTVSVWQSR